MPRADPERSAYCASRHLLRNLDDAAELRRNPLVRDFFADGEPLTQAFPTVDVAARVRGLVHESLARFRDRPGRGRAALARMQAVLLRCEIERRPLPDVAAELALSDRQVRRERRAAHDAFLRAFHSTAAVRPAALVCDTAAIRIAAAVELHELGRSEVALASCSALVACPPSVERLIEAVCLRAEIELDAGRTAAAWACAAHAQTVLATRSDELRDGARATAAERIDLLAWSLRLHGGDSAGLATPPPLAVARAAVASRGDEPRRAVLVRALAAYAIQRSEVGDGLRCRTAVARAQQLVPTLDVARTKERFAVMYAEGLLHSLGEIGADLDHFVALERLALQRGHVRTLLSARAERIGIVLSLSGGAEGVYERIVAPFDAGDRRLMPHPLATAARIAAQCERDHARALSAVELAERLVAPRSANALLARCIRVGVSLSRRRYDEAWQLAHAIRTDAELAGNGRLRGSAARYLAAVAHARHRRRDAQRYIREALPLLERFGTTASFTQAQQLARRLGVD